MQKITTFLTFNDQAEAAVELYTSVFESSKLVSKIPGPNGSLMGATFELEGQQFIALNGGPSFAFAQGISLFVSCETQAEVDRYWEKLSEGGVKNRCGWLQDRFGVSWQIVPSILGRLLGDKDRIKAGRVMTAMLGMDKLEIAGLKRAYEG